MSLSESRVYLTLLITNGKQVRLIRNVEQVCQIGEGRSRLAAVTVFPLFFVNGV